MRMHVKMTTVALIIGLLLFAPVAASAQETDDTSAGFDTSAEVDVNAEAEMDDSSASASSDTTYSGETVELDPGPNRSGEAGEGAADAGTLGVGADGMLSGLAGLQARFQATDTLGFQLALRFNVAALTQTEVGFGAGFSVIYTLFAFEGGHLGLVAGLDFQLRDQSQPAPASSVTAWRMGFGAGLFAEIFPAKFFSIHGQVGAGLGFGDDGGASTFDLAVGGDVFAGFGFTFWFV